MINKTHRVTLKRQAKLLGISRATLYYLPKPTSARDIALMHAMDRVHLQHPFMGARQLRGELAKLGLYAGRVHLRTLMGRMGIRSIAPQPGSSKPAPGHVIYPYLLRDVVVTRINHVWALDTTYIPMSTGFVYLVAVIDVASRKVMSHKVATTLEASHAVEILEQAMNRYGVPQIVNTDQGSQFSAQVFVDAVKSRGAQLSMDGKGAWRDNVFIERLWRSVKYEHVYLNAYDSVAQARQGIGGYLHWYNSARKHSSLGDQIPDDLYSAELQSSKPLKCAA
jgi:putative transposase